MPAILAMLLSNWQAIFGVIQMVETMFGPKPGQGADKLKAATDFIKTVMPTVADVVSNHQDGSTHLDNVVSGIVKLANATEAWNTQYSQQLAPSA